MLLLHYNNKNDKFTNTHFYFIVSTNIPFSDDSQQSIGMSNVKHSSMKKRNLCR